MQENRQKFDLILRDFILFLILFDFVFTSPKQRDSYYCILFSYIESKTVVIKYESITSLLST